MTNQCCLSFVKVAANSRKIVEFGIAKKFGFVVFVGISSPLLTVSEYNGECKFNVLSQDGLEVNSKYRLSISFLLLYDQQPTTKMFRYN